MRTNPTNKHNLSRIVHLNVETKLIPFDIEDHAVFTDKARRRILVTTTVFNLKFFSTTRCESVDNAKTSTNGHFREIALKENRRD